MLPPAPATDADTAGGFVAIGNFDGVHRGHQAMIAALKARADAAGVPAVAVTFDPPPVELLRPEFAPPRLTRPDQKAERLHAAGADRVTVLATDKGLLRLSAEAFFAEVLLGRLGARGVVEGPNFRFGRGREGDVTLLRRLCERAGIPCYIVKPVETPLDRGGEVMISSSLVREQVSAGFLTTAAELLGRFHEALGTVVRGAGRGGPLGFPTANIAGIETLLPPDGVYAARTTIDGRAFAAAVHLGINSTFDATARTFEAHLLDFAGDLYGRELRIELIDRVRESERFADAAALVAQLHRDCDRVSEIVAAQ